jgi:hypothetical protein
MHGWVVKLLSEFLTIYELNAMMSTGYYAGTHHSHLFLDCYCDRLTHGSRAAACLIEVR